MVGGLVLASPSDGTWLVLANTAAFVTVAAISMTFPPAGGHAPTASPDERVWRDRLFHRGVALLNGVWLLVGLAVEIGLPIYLVLYLHTPAVLISAVVVLSTGLVFPYCNCPSGE